MISSAAARVRPRRSRSRRTWVAAMPAVTMEGSVPSPNMAIAAALNSGSACTALKASVE